MNADLVAWVSHRMTDLAGREGPASLHTIGAGGPPEQGYTFPKKALGSWAFSLSAEAGDARRVLQRRGLRVSVDFAADRFWVYAWDRLALTTILQARRHVLVEAGLPLDPALPIDGHAFVQWTRQHRAAPGTALFDLIADCYADKSGPGRSDVLPHYPRSVLLQAFATGSGYVDPTFLFFEPESGHV